MILQVSLYQHVEGLLCHVHTLTVESLWKLEKFQKYKLKHASKLEFTVVAGALGITGTIISLLAII